MRRAVVPAVVLALVAAAPAAAHVTLVPASGDELIVRVPNERDVPTTRVRVAAPPGARILVAAPRRGWRVRASRGAVVWSGGAIAAHDYADFRVRTGAGATGTWSVEQRFRDGVVQPWAPSARALAPTGVPGRGLLYGAIGVSLVLLGALWVVRPRRERGPLPTV